PRERAARDAPIEIFAVEILHQHARRSVGESFEAEDLDDVGMLQARNNIRLATKAQHRFATSAGERFEREGFFELGVAHFVHRSHSAATDFAHDAIAVRDDLADQVALGYRHGSASLLAKRLYYITVAALLNRLFVCKISLL